MSWNEPGDRDDKPKKKDPWGRQDEAGPPNIDEALRQLHRKLKAMFGGGQVPPTPSFGGSNKPTTNKTFSLTIVGIILIGVYLISGIYVVEPAEEAVVLRLGRYVDTKGPGPHWIAPFLETKEVLNVQEIKTSKHGGQMLTKDDNIVSAEIAVHYRIGNAKDYLFNLVQPEKSLQQVSESALRAVVGQSTLNEVLTVGRGEIAEKIRKLIQENLNNYKSGLEISDLKMQQTKAPEEVKAAFDDAIKAQQDEERLVNEAKAYSRKIIPIAEGRATRTLEEANAYKQSAILDAQGKTSKFAQVLPEYRRSPQVTRDRLYIDALQEVYARTPKVLVDISGGNNLVYLPLDKLTSQGRALMPVKEEGEQSSSTFSEKPTQSMNGYQRGVKRPTYEDVESSTRGGA